MRVADECIVKLNTFTSMGTYLWRPFQLYVCANVTKFVIVEVKHLLNNKCDFNLSARKMN